MAERLLEVDELQVSFVTEDGVVKAVDGVSFTLDRGEVVAIVGESGSGKSVTAMTLMGLTRGANARFAGSAKVHGEELVTATEAKLQKIRGEEIAMIFQDPISSLSPVHRIGDQIVEQIRTHEKVSKAAALDRTVQLMERVGIPRAAERARAYPHEFSGGMRQRAMIAMALSLSPSVLIADEPTTALDVTIQAQILEEIRQLSQESDSGVIFVTHDLGVVADIADRVVVMPIVTLFGLDFALLLGGAALVTETVFNLPGIGQFEANAIGNLDVPPILVGAIFTAFFVVLFGAIVDVLYAVLDPRVRLTG